MPGSYSAFPGLVDRSDNRKQAIWTIWWSWVCCEDVISADREDRGQPGDLETLEGSRVGRLKRQLAPVLVFQAGDENAQTCGVDEVQLRQIDRDEANAPVRQTRGVRLVAAVRWRDQVLR